MCPSLTSRFRKFLSTVCLLASMTPGWCATYAPSSVPVPPPTREFRGLWIATVANIDWPSRPGLPPAAQRAELISILDRAAALNLNAVILQVRPACDAFYPSALEPWSEYLTGAMGAPPEPFYDPLLFAIREAHQRGLELHAWFNPYRALHKSHEGRVATNHISRTHPQLVKRHGEYLWLDPGEPQVQEYSLKVVMDVVRRYDIDAVHFDDYFYPDPAEGGLPFPDESSWKRIGANGNLSHGDWRRDNVNTFIERVYRAIKAEKPWVKFGVSPHGIWRPGNPPQIRGSDSYVKLSADSRKWLMNGWVDYFSPQLYWTIASREQSFPALLNWWHEQNPKERHIWPGMSAAYALSQKWKPDEIANQIDLTRKRAKASAAGYLIYSASKLLTNAALMKTLQSEVQPTRALVPAMPWLSQTRPARPTATVSGNPEALQLTWKPGDTNVVRWWVVQTRTNGKWQMTVLPATVRKQSLGNPPEIISVAAVDRFGNLGPGHVLQARKATPRPRIPHH